MINNIGYSRQEQGAKYLYATDSEYRLKDIVELFYTTLHKFFELLETTSHKLKLELIKEKTNKSTKKNLYLKLPVRDKYLKNLLNPISDNVAEILLKVADHINELRINISKYKSIDALHKDIQEAVCILKHSFNFLDKVFHSNYPIAYKSTITSYAEIINNDSMKKITTCNKQIESALINNKIKKINRLCKKLDNLLKYYSGDLRIFSTILNNINKLSIQQEPDKLLYEYDYKKITCSDGKPLFYYLQEIYDKLFSQCIGEGTARWEYLQIKSDEKLLYKAIDLLNNTFSELDNNISKVKKQNTNIDINDILQEFKDALKSLKLNFQNNKFYREFLANFNNIN